MKPIEAYFAIVQRHTPASAVIGLTTIVGTYVHTRWYMYQNIARLVEDAINVDRRANVYARITPLAKPPAAGRGLERQSLGASVLWVDLDSYKSQIDGLRALQSFPLPPTMIVNSGNGLHAYWLLDRFYMDLDAIKARNKGLTFALNQIDPGADADSCFDLARVLRVPGTYNIKRDPVECTIVELDASRVYTLDQFEAAPIEDRAIDYWDSEQLPGDFIDSVRERDAKLAKRILSEDGAKRCGAPLNGNGGVDRSRNDAYIATRLLALGYSPGIVLSVLQSPEWFSGAKYRERYRYDYVVMTVNNAAAAYANSADRYFTKTTFQADKLGAELDTANAFIYVGERLYRYVAGVYNPDAEEYIKAEVVKRLGRRWTSRASDETVRWIIDQSRVDLEAVNQYSGYINCANGMLNVETARLEPHDPRYLSTAQIPIAYNPDADTGEIDRFVGSVLAADAVPLFWEYVGSAFVMDRYWPKAFVALVGPRNSGKSKILEWLVRFYGGRSNVVALSLQTLADNRFAASSLYGRIANIFSDLDESEAQNTGMLKTLTGDDYMSGEQKFRGHFMFKNTARLWFSANSYPAVRNPDEAYFVRAHIIPCVNVFTPGKNADPEIVAKMSTPANLAAGLIRAYEGLRRLLANGTFTTAPSVTRANDDYRFSADTVSGFLHTCALDADYFVPKTVFYQLYREACITSGRKPVSDDKFYKRIADNLVRFAMSDETRTMPNGERQNCYCGRRPPAQSLTMSLGIPDFKTLPIKN